MRKTLGYTCLFIFLACTIILAVGAFITHEYVSGMLSLLVIPAVTWMILVGKFDWKYISLEESFFTKFMQVKKFHHPLARYIDTGEGVIDLKLIKPVTPRKYWFRWTIYYDPNTCITVFCDNAAGLAVNHWYFSN